MADVFVLGMASVDFVFGVQTLPREAQKYRAETADIVGGGIAANAAVAIARLGGRAVLATRLGDDALADLIEADLQAAGVNTAFVHRAPNGRSSFSSIYVDAAGERQIVNYRGEGLTAETAWLQGAGPAQAVLADTRWPDGAAAALRMARDWGVPGVLDAEAPVAPELLRTASHVAFSRAGLSSVRDDADAANALRAVAADLPGWACVTDGENGVFHTDGTSIAHLPAFEVPVADTLAAGDVWHGAFALALAEGQTEPAAMRFASAAAALKCMRFGGRAGCPDRAAVTAFLEERA